MHSTDMLLRLCLVGTLALASLLGSRARGEWFSDGDRVVVVAETPVMDETRTVTRLAAGANFLVKGVHGGYVSIVQSIDGSMVSGWVNQNDVMKLDRNHRAVYATRDNLVSNQGQTLKLPRGLPVHIRFQSTSPVDFFIITEEGVESYKWVMKHGSGQVSSRRRELSTQSVALAWTPPDNNQHYVLVDNSRFADGGANSGRTIYYTLAYCIEDPMPAGPRSGLGLLIGRATLDFDNYEGRNGRLRESYKVAVEALENDKVVETLEAMVDDEGYFFLENVSTSRQYRIKKLEGSNFNSPLTVRVTHPFATTSGEREGGRMTVVEGTMHMVVAPCGTAAVLDLGHSALRVNSKGKIQTRVDGPGCSIADIDNMVSFGGSGQNAPLDRHEWFLQNFPDNGWTEKVKADRDAIYREREETKRKAEDEKRKKEEEKERKKREEEAKRRKDEPHEPQKRPPLPAAPAPAPAPASSSPSIAT